ncbi:hypothetical protein VTO58DRAFT_109920 [Aureobasidium pullulans]|nr:hypothetical protein D6C80_05065 [Aureobasidium pullulans]
MAKNVRDKRAAAQKKAAEVKARATKPLATEKKLDTENKEPKTDEENDHTSEEGPDITGKDPGIADTTPDARGRAVQRRRGVSSSAHTSRPPSAATTSTRATTRSQSRMGWKPVPDEEETIPAKTPPEADITQESANNPDVAAEVESEVERLPRKSPSERVGYFYLDDPKGDLSKLSKTFKTYGRVVSFTPESYLGWAEFESTEVRNKIVKASPHTLDRKKVVVEQKMRSYKGVHAKEQAKLDSEQEQSRKPPQVLTSLAVQDAAMRLQGALTEVNTVSNRMGHGTLSQSEIDHSLAQAMLHLLDLT